MIALHGFTTGMLSVALAIAAAGLTLKATDELFAALPVGIIVFCGGVWLAYWHARSIGLFG